MEKPIQIINGDITTIECDAIVNAANSTLLCGGGVDGAIHKVAGSELLEECRRLREEKYPYGLPPGEAVITKAYNLPSKYVIHTVGPIWGGGNNGESEILYNCYFNSLLLAKENSIKTIAFPEISTGAYGYPKEEARKIAQKAMGDFCDKYPDVFEKIFVVVYKKQTL